MNPPIRFIALGAAFLAVASCSSEKKAADTTRDTSVVVAEPSSAPAPAASPAPTPAAPLPVSSWKVDEFGIGPLRAGMSAREGVAMLQHQGVSITPDTEKGCHYLKWGGPPGVKIMMDEGVIARVEVDSGSVATTAGAHVGDAESQIKTLYAGRVAVQPHKYTSGGHYLVVTPSPATEKKISEVGTDFHIVFETDGQKVTKYRAGKQPQVSYVEGCG